MNSQRDALTERIIGCAIAVHRELGPGLLEAIYEEALFDRTRRTGLGLSPTAGGSCRLQRPSPRRIPPRSPRRGRRHCRGQECRPDASGFRSPTTHLPQGHGEEDRLAHQLQYKAPQRRDQEARPVNLCVSVPRWPIPPWSRHQWPRYQLGHMTRRSEAQPR